MSLLNDDFLLGNATARDLFHNYAKAMPIIDFHCHLNPKEIYENKNYANITRIWLNEGNYGDHYKWRLMRANGVPEELITGDGDEYAKFVAWAKTLGAAYGNPVYEWTHLELQRFFNITEELTEESAPRIWEQTNALLQTDAFKPRNLIKQANVQVVCTTDDPADDLKYHQLLQATAKEDGFKTLPTMRPDKLFQIDRDSFGAYLQSLGAIAGVEIKHFADIITALEQRFTAFNALGGRLSDQSLLTYTFVEATDAQIETIVQKGIENQALTQTEIDQYLTRLLKHLMELNTKFNWTMQFHINSNRNLNQPMFAKIGPDTGYDAVGTQADIVTHITQLFTTMSAENSIPKTILYSLNSNDWTELATMMGSFQGGSVQKIQLGAGWWFNDTAEGMDEQLRVFAHQSLLANFVGMLTDSRSFLSYPRHEYFRRVLCNFYGNLAEQGRVPSDLAKLGQIVENISYNNAKTNFGFFD
ncbi:MAG: glucuronate isomerase [Lactobacillaceae bacterium]|jgi:glucuronate isomerase|nr:glucuronate isomerase [Lactobacillaceae bacterium]